MSNGKKIDWLNHGLEFIVVIIGILIAFQLNKCGTENEQAKTINMHLQQIKDETKFNKYFLEKGIKHTQSNIAKLDSIFMFIAQKKETRKINLLSMQLLSMSGVYIRKNAYLNFIESGDIRFMKDFKRKQKIINLYEYYKWVESFNEVSRNLYSTDYYPYLKDNFDLLGGTTQSDDIYFSTLFKNILSSYSYTSKNRLERYEGCMKEIEKYLGEDGKK